MQFRRTCALCTLPLLLAGCVALSDSSSKIVSSPFEWASDSSRSSSDALSEAYQGDVAEFTDVFVRSGRDVGTFAGGLSAVAQKHGITDWRAEPATYTAIGRGLRKAEASSADVARFTHAVAADDSLKAQAIQRAFDRQS